MFRVFLASLYLYAFLVTGLPALAQVPEDFRPTLDLSEAILSSPEKLPIVGLESRFHVALVSDTPEALDLAFKLIDLRGYRLLADATDSEGTAVDGISPVEMTINDNALRLDETLSAEPGQGPLSPSRFIRLTLWSATTDRPDLRIYFDYPKTWDRPSVIVRPRPHGQATAFLARIKQGTSDLPTRTIRLDPGAQISLDPAITLTPKALELRRDIPTIDPSRFEFFPI